MGAVSSAELAVSRWAAWAPGLTDQESWVAWAKGSRQISGPVNPDVSFVKPLLRRRLSPLNRMAFNVAWRCLPEGQAPFCIFCSRYGEFARAFDILRAMSEGEPVSPNTFSLSVHNTVSSQFSIARGDRTHSTAVAAGASTLEAGFIEASGLLAESPEASALLVYFDEPLPDLYAGQAEAVRVSAALAILLQRPQRAEDDPVLRLTWQASDNQAAASDRPLNPALRLVRLLTEVETQGEIDDGRLLWTWSWHAAGG